MEKLRKTNEKGITLIALVITIIVLIILAGITLNLLMGDNGILTRAKGAKEEFNKTKMLENTTLILMDYSAEHELTGITLAEYLTRNNIAYETEDGKIKFVEEGYVIKVDPITLELDGPTKSNKEVAMSLNSNVVEPGNTLTVTLTPGEDVDIANCKYEFLKSDVEVNNENRESKVTTQVSGTIINVTTPSEKGEYYFYLLVAYKNSSEKLLKKVEVKVDVEPTGITLNKTSLALNSGETDTLTASVEPANAEQGVTWYTSDENVATVNSSGVVNAVSGGTATITAVSIADNNITNTCLVTIIQKATGVSLNKTTLSINKAQTETLIATVSPDNTNNKAVTWASDNDSVVTVDQNGLVTAVAPGTATITVATADGSNKSESCTVSVLQVWEKYSVTPPSEYSYRIVSSNNEVNNFNPTGYYVIYGNNVTYSTESSSSRVSLTSEREIGNGFDSTTGLWTGDLMSTDQNDRYDLIGAIVYSAPQGETSSSEVMFIHYGDRYNYSLYDVYTSYPTSEYGKGDYIENVTSTNANQYPADGYQEENGTMYWYVKK